MLPLARTRAKRPCLVKRALFLLAGLFIKFLAACHFPDINPNLDDIADYACNGQCGNFEQFLGQNVHLEIETAGGTSQIFYNIDPLTLTKEPIILQKIVRISGRAFGAERLLDDAANNGHHDKSAAFSDILAIPSINRVNFLAPRIPTFRSRLNSETTFQIDLLAGLSYTLILNPAGSLNRAPIHLNIGPISTNGANAVSFSLNNKLTTLIGRVVSEDTEIVNHQKQSQLQARLMQGSRLISSIGTVDRDGRFILEVSNPFFEEIKEQPISLIVEPINFEIPLPRISQKIEADFSLDHLDIGTINLGKLKKPISLSIEVHGSDDSAIGNAFLYLGAKVGNGELLIKKQVNGAGIISIPTLYEGSYDIAIIPPVNSSFAMKVIKAVEIDSKDNTQISIDLQKRAALNAVISGPSGLAISGAQIELARIGEMGNFATEDIYDDNLFKLTASTNAEGKLCHRKFGFSTSDKSECLDLLLDEGRYLAHVIPPAGTQLSHKWLTFDFPDQKNLNINLDQPKILFGRVLKPNGKTPAKRAFVTVYLAETNLYNQPKMVGNGITDDNGFFKAFVSAP